MSYIISTLPLEKPNYTFGKFFILNNDTHNEIYTTTNQFLLVEGFLYDLNLNKKLLPEEIVELVQKSISKNEVFPDNITGQFNIVYISDTKIIILNDFVGLKPIYYHFGKEIIVSNNIYKFFDFDFEIDEIAFFQSMIGSLYIPLNSRSLIKNVSLLRGGEYIFHNTLSSAKEILVDKMIMSNAKIGAKQALDIVDLLKNNASIYSSIFDKIVLPISAGVDSRITLSAFSNITSKFHTVSYGEADYIDNKIAKKLANFIGVSHVNISFKNHLFPTQEEFTEMVDRGGEYFVSAWFSVINELKADKEFDNSVVLLGDILDTLRAKNLKFLRSRKQRFKFQLKNAFGLEIKLENLNLESYVSNQVKVYLSKIQNLKELYPYLFEKFDFDELQFAEQTRQDLQNFITFINIKFSPQNQANLEEAFYICTWGARTMSKQTNVFKGHFQSFVLMASRHVVKYNLQFCPLERFEDKLTHKLLRTKGFNAYSHFPTAQIPFVAYNRNIYLKYVIWAMRSSIDQLLIKAGKGRLVKHIEWAQYYTNARNKSLLHDLLKEVDSDLSKIPMEIFSKRASGELWPLSEVDINVYSYLFKMR